MTESVEIRRDTVPCARCHQSYYLEEYFHIWTLVSSGVRYISSLAPSITPEIPLQIPGTPHEHFDLSKYEVNQHNTLMCHLCVVELETRHIKGLPLEDLPFYLNAEWITVRGYQAYMKRLETLSPST